MIKFTADASALVSLLEALYDLERPRDVWFRTVLKTASVAFDRGAGVGMILYDVSKEVVRLDAMDGINVEQRNVEMSRELHANPKFGGPILASYRNEVCATMREHVRDADLLGEAQGHYAKVGLGDQIMVNGGNPDGLGCVLYIFSETRLQLGAEERSLLTRVATHLSAAYRLHRRFHDAAAAGTTAVDAILRVDGKVEHAGPAVDSKALLRELSNAVNCRERAKSRGGSGPSGDSSTAWRPMVAARWSLVDSYERSGVRYVTARRNQPVPEGMPALSARERQVTSLAALGHSNKLIAYELGVAHSTVRVLLARAAAKLGARTRSEVIGQVRAHG